MPSDNLEPKVAIVVVNWNQYDDTYECLESLQKVGYPNYEIILVDNESSDGLADAISRDFPGLFLFRNEENLGFAQGNNIGIQFALKRDCDYVLLVNNDTVVHPSIVRELVRVAEAEPEIGILAPKILFYNAPQRLWCLGGRLLWPLGRMIVPGRDQPDPYPGEGVFEFEFVSGAGMLIRADLFREIGLFDGKFFLYWEDTDLCVRARSQGWKVKAASSAVMWHKVSRACAGRLRTYYSSRNRLYFFAKHRKLTRWFPLVVAVDLAYMSGRSVVFALTGRTPEAIAGLLGTLDFFRKHLGRGSLDLV